MLDRLGKVVPNGVVGQAWVCIRNNGAVDSTDFHTCNSSLIKGKVLLTRAKR